MPAAAAAAAGQRSRQRTGQMSYWARWALSSEASCTHKEREALCTTLQAFQLSLFDASCLQDLMSLATWVCSGLQLGNVHPDHEAADMNVSAVALAAVDIAATALDSALLTVERTVERSQQRPEVRKLGELTVHVWGVLCGAVSLLVVTHSVSGYLLHSVSHISPDAVKRDGSMQHVWM